MTTAEQRVVECAVRAIHTGRMFEASLTLAARARAGVERGRAMDALIDAVDALGGASPGSDGDVVRDGGGAMTMETITDNVFHEYTVKRADPTPDGWTVHFVEGFAIHVPSRRESTAPAPGETIRCYGKGFGYEVHGITVGGRVYRYQSAEAYRAEFLRSLQRPAPVDDVTAAVAAERARCAAVCREVAAGYDGHAGAVARQCAEAIERGAVG